MPDVDFVAVSGGGIDVPITNPEGRGDEGGDGGVGKGKGAETDGGELGVACGDGK